MRYFRRSIFLDKDLRNGKNVFIVKTEDELDRIITLFREQERAGAKLWFIESLKNEFHYYMRMGIHFCIRPKVYIDENGNVKSIVIWGASFKEYDVDKEKTGIRFLDSMLISAHDHCVFDKSEMDISLFF